MPQRAKAMKDAEAAWHLWKPLRKSQRELDNGERDNGNRNGNGNGKSFRSKDSILRKARATCSAHSFSDRAIHFGCGIRLSIAMDETPRLGGRSLLQPAGGSGVHAPGYSHWTARMAVP